MSEAKDTRCPFCDIPLISVGEDLFCIHCRRDWYWTEVDGEKSLASRQRKVKLKKWPPEAGDKMDDLIEPLPAHSKEGG